MPPPPPYDPRSLKPSAALRRALAGRRVLITGAALDGVGRILAHIHALHGAEVALADVLPLEAVTAECRALGAARVVACAFDAAREGEGARMVREACSQLSGGALDAVFLNHNIGVFAPMMQQPDLLGAMRRLMSVNFFAYAEIAHAAMPMLSAAARARGGARGAASSIVVISSLAAEMPMLDTHAYAASKAAISAWFNCLRIELRRDAELAALVSVSVVYFSAVRTATLVRAMGGEGGPNRHVLALAADPVDAAYATVDACVQRRPVTHFPSNIAVVPKIYAIWPWLARKIVSSVVVKHAPPSPPAAAPAPAAAAAPAPAPASALVTAAEARSVLVAAPTSA
jgi:short-subunit dehydrogenase